MGQYHKLVNFDRKEIVHPHKLGLGLKQVEHTGCPASLSDALYLLLSTSPAAGGGDLQILPDREQEFQSFGRWVGDRVTVFGDYTEVEEFGIIEKMCPADWNEKDSRIDVYLDSFADITDDLIPAYSKAYGVKIDASLDGWRDRKLLPSMWSWLFELKDNKKAATV